jgi:hypothetical protein
MCPSDRLSGFSTVRQITNRPPKNSKAEDKQLVARDGVLPLPAGTDNAFPHLRSDHQSLEEAVVKAGSRPPEGLWP